MIWKYIVYSSLASGPITSWQIDGETVADFIFWGSKITSDGDWSLEIKRRFLLERKAMTNLDSILKSRNITLPAKLRLFKAMVFPVVMYGLYYKAMVFPVVMYESCTIKKIECRRIDAFELWCWRRLVRVPWTARRSNQSILKEISPEYSLEQLMLKLKLQYFGQLMQSIGSLEKTDSGKDWRQEKGTTEDEMVGWHHRLHGHEFEQAVGDGEGQGSPECCSCKESQRVGYSWVTAAAAAKLLRSCPTLCDPIDGSPPGSSIPGILQARTLGWVAIAFSNVWKWKMKVKSLSRVWLFATPKAAAYQAPPSMGFSRQEYWSRLPLPSLNWVTEPQQICISEVVDISPGFWLVIHPAWHFRWHTLHIS